MGGGWGFAPLFVTASIAFSGRLGCVGIQGGWVVAVFVVSVTGSGVGGVGAGGLVLASFLFWCW